MPPTNAMAVAGAVLKRGDGGSPEAFAPVYEVVNIDGPGLKVDVKEVTTMLSPNNNKEYIPTNKSLGPVKLDMNWVPQDASMNPVSGFIADREARTLRNYKEVLPDEELTTMNFAAYVTDISPMLKQGDALTCTVTLTPTGTVTWTTGG